VTAVTNLQVLDFIFVLVGLSTKKQQKTKMAGPDPKVGPATLLASPPPVHLHHHN
jgi:hypothetical protein